MERYTRQRNAILNAIVVAARPLSPQEIHEAAAPGSPTLGIATVYRTIRMLLEEAAIRTVELPGEPARYESADLGHHHHFKCTACQRVFDVEECAADLHELVPVGFTLQGHDITLYGRCEDCGRGANGAARRAPRKR
jgi:Fur family ferric uptake transcriptional regulator